MTYDAWGKSCKDIVRCIYACLMHNNGHSYEAQGCRSFQVIYNLPLIYKKRSLRLKNSNPTKVLIINDDEATCESLKLILEPEYFEGIEATTGAKGIHAAKQFKPDVIIMDLLIPDMDSWRVIKEIRVFSQVPILVLSAVSKTDLVAKALDEGADEYLTKPIPNTVLVAHLNRLVRRARAEVSSDIHFHP